MNKKIFKKNVFAFLLVCLIVFAVISVGQGAKNAIVSGSVDFQYDSFKLFSMRINPYDETLAPTNVSKDLNLTKYYDRLEANQFPSFLAIMTPLAIFPPYVANIIWCISNLALTAFMLILLRKLLCPEMPSKIYIAISCLMLMGLGWRNSVGMGQHTIFSMFFFVLAMYLSQNKKSVAAGIMLAISFFKYTLTVPLAIYFVYKRKFKELIISVIIHIALTIFSAFWLRESIINLILKPLKITSWLGNEGYIDFGAVLNLEGSSSLIITVTLMLAFLIVAVFISKEKTDNFFSNGDFLSLLCYLSMVIVYHRAYDFFVWIVPCMIYMYSYYTTKQQKFELIASAILFVYSNFLSRALFGLCSIFPQISNYVFLSDIILAILTNAFIIYLAVKIIKKLSKKQHNQPKITN